MARVINVLAVFFAFAIDLALIFRLRHYYRHLQTDSKMGLKGVYFLGAYSPILSWLRECNVALRSEIVTSGLRRSKQVPILSVRKRWFDSWRKYWHQSQAVINQWRLQNLVTSAHKHLREKTTKQFSRLQTFTTGQAAKKIGIACELILIGIWAVFVCRQYLNFDPHVWPGGSEFGSAIQANNIWTQFRSCGWCAMWSGFEQGGHPALADVQASILHPIVIFTTLIWGVVNGAKITLIIALWCAGLAQWWIARSLKLSVVPRLWSAGIAVAGGYITGRMELGTVGVVLSTAMVSLVLAGVVYLVRNPGRRAAILLGILIALAIVSGQGYMQIGLLAISPALLLLLLKREEGIWSIGKEFLIAAALAILLASPFLVPFFHFSPNFTKDTDASFVEAQPLAYLPLNLVIDDVQYYQTNILGKFPYPYEYNLYIGWIPVILAFFGIARVRSEDKRLFWFMGVSIVLAFLIASAVLLKWLVIVWPAVSAVRHSPQIASIAVPYILAFSAFGLEQLRISSQHWPDLSIGFSASNMSRKMQIPLQWLLLIPLVYSLVSVYNFSQNWLTTTTIGDDVYSVLSTLKTSSLEWVEPPYGEHYWIQPAIELGLKLSPGIMNWNWKGRDMPTASLYATRSGPPPGTVREVGTINGLTIYASNEEYTAVVHGKTQEACKASGVGGLITVKCDTTEPGQLVVKENMWSGWYAWLDGQPVKLYPSAWLEVDAPAGAHTFTFRYLPWDVPLGLALFVLGVCACIWLWIGPSGRSRPT